MCVCTIKRRKSTENLCAKGIFIKLKNRRGRGGRVCAEPLFGVVFRRYNNHNKSIFDTEEITMAVTVYTTTTCPWCVKTKEFLTSLNVQYEVKNVSGDKAAAMEMVKKTHQMGVPVTQIGEKFIVGYDPDALTAELKAGGYIK